MHKYAGIARQLPQTARQLPQDLYQLTIELEILRETRNKIIFRERKRLIVTQAIWSSVPIAPSFVYCCCLKKMGHLLLHSPLLHPPAPRPWLWPMGQLQPPGPRFSPFLGSYSYGPGAWARAQGLEPGPGGSQGPGDEAKP